MEEVRIEVPASTSNLGPGFDTLGLALDWKVETEVKKSKKPLTISTDLLRQPEYNEPMALLAMDAIKAWEKKTGESARGSFAFRSDIPVARGLGSSATFRLAAIAAANYSAGEPLDRKGVLELACRLEKHTDNAVPCMVGGLTVSGWDEGAVRYARFELGDEYRFVVLVPNKKMPTEESRKILPEKIDRADAVFNVQRALWLLAALVKGKPEDLRGAFADRLHQPYREKIAPFLPDVIRAAERAGAFGAFLSGSGSSTIAVTDEDTSDKVEKAMVLELERLGERGEARTLLPDNQGLRVID